MMLQKIPFRSTHAFTEFFQKYIEQHPSLKSYYNHFPSLENFGKQIKEKAGSFPKANRKVLVDVLQRQYQPLKPIGAVETNIQSLLEENTFTVTTGHQLSIFTGPLYFIYKIVTVIRTCQELKKKYPKSHFVPVYWMASEDHDYEEIKSFRLYGKKYTWETVQQGAVGRFQTKDIKQLFDQLPGEVGIFREAYLKSGSLSEAVRKYVHALFASEGLIVMEADDKDFKTLFQKVMSDDLFEHTPFKLVTETNKELEALDLHPQVNPREINFFYLEKDLRSRLEQHGKAFPVVDTDLKFSKEEITKKIKESPEVFSPNVILRPLYQEMILPNLAYVGGPAELVYWLELKKVFDHHQTPFPILLPRNFALIVDAPTSRKISKTRLHLEAFFEEKDDLYKRWLSQHSTHNLSLDETSRQLDQLLAEVQARCANIDATLSPMAAAQAAKMKKMIQTIELKMVRAEKRLQSDSLRQIEVVKDALFPNGSLQERTDNFLNFYQQDASFIEKLLEHFDPFDFQFNVLSYHDQKGTSEILS